MNKVIKFLLAATLVLSIQPTQCETNYDLSGIKTLDFSTINLEQFLLEFPRIEKYTLPDGREVWFFLDHHGSFVSELLMKKVLATEKFTHAIIEKEMMAYYLMMGTEKFPLSLTKEDYILQKFFDASEALHAYRGANTVAWETLQNTETVILPGEFKTVQEALENYNRIGGLSNEEIFLHLWVLVINTLLECNKIIEPLLLVEHREPFKKVSREISEQVFQRAHNFLGIKNPHELAENLRIKGPLYIEKSMTPIITKGVYTRDMKIAQTILNTCSDTRSQKTLIVYGGLHWGNLQDVLEQYFGKSVRINPNEYITPEENEKINGIMKFIVEKLTAQ